MKNDQTIALVLRRALLFVLLLACPLLATSSQTPPSQIQVARRFLVAIVRGEWATAYQCLAPETRQGLSVEQFQAAAQPFVAQSQHYGPVIDLYKLGYRLRGAETPQPFVAFSFRADTLRRLPHFQLDVTFRDSTARQVQGFGLIPLQPVTNQ
ncbi:hypothetical protein [Hymenobacter sublimis]|uniref:DUF3887 domain-containing protein n=1 Tax=Hymenobacter sublimis TaxID=2933777 RepID=A0ABY4J6I3_9BACT|nr:hypothetical protein [Hymenobacter sublimis]UPL48445.1 hypothetical protein MWH26_14755 [Hymenobacter sublimis]